VALRTLLFTAQYASTVQNASAQISVANTARNGTGTIVSVMTGAANGSRIDDISIVATATTTAGVVRLFISDGSNIRLWQEILVSAVTPSTTVQVWSYTLLNQALLLENGWSPLRLRKRFLSLMAYSVLRRCSLAVAVVAVMLPALLLAVVVVLEALLL